MAQMQAGMLVTGRNRCDYLSFCGGMHLWAKTVWAEPNWQEVLIAAAEQFERDVTEVVDLYAARTKGLILTERTPDYAEIRF
jgi:hypothetical protein